jgi:hypothetical protein
MQGWEGAASVTEIRTNDSKFDFFPAGAFWLAETVKKTRSNAANTS